MATEGDWDAGAYHKVSEPQLRWGRAVLARLALRGDEAVLDAGCGSGRLTAEVAAAVPRGRVIAVDVSDAMVAEARRTLAPLGDRVEVVKADLAALGMEGIADVAFSAATFHWVLDHDALFDSLYRALRPGGVLEAQCGGEGNLAGTLARAAEWLAANADPASLSGWRYPAYFASVEDTERRLRARGFEDVRVWLEGAPTPFASAGDYRLFLEKVVLLKVLARLPDEAARGALLDAMVERSSRDEAPFTLDYVRLNLHARRAR